MARRSKRAGRRPRVLVPGRCGRAARAWSLSLLFLSAVAGSAQEPPDENVPPEGAPVVEDEIEVTAQRVEQALREVPISILALSGDELEDRGIGDVQALADAAPGVVVSGHSPVTGEVSLFFRGVGSNASGLGVESAVGYYVDGVYMPRPQSLVGTFLDLERAEVLRGPQGTLWGRNSTGGAISLVTRPPEPEFKGALRAALRRFESSADAAGSSYGLAVTGPLTERLWARFAGMDLSVEDPTWNEHLGATNKNLDGFSGRGALNFLASDTLTLLLRADVTDDDHHHNFPLKPGDTSPRSIVGTLVRFYGLSDPPDIHRAASGELPVSAFEESGVSLHGFKSLRRGRLNLTSISSAREFASSRRADVDGTALSFVDTAGSFDSEWWSQELQLQGAGESLSFTFGLYGFGEKGRHLTEVRTDEGVAFTWIFASLGRFFGLDPETYCSIETPSLCGPALYEELAGSLGFPLPGRLVTGNRIDTSLDSVSHAAYGQIDWDFGDRFTLTTGLRYSEDDKDYALATIRVDPSTRAPAFDTDALSDSWRKVTPKIGLEVRPRNDLMLYAALSTGYKSGGFNAISFQPSFGPETMESLEVGFKVSRPGVTLNASAFRYDYDDMQVEVLQLDRSYVANAAGAGARGIDLDLRARPARNLAFDLSMEFLDDEFESFDSLDPVAIARFIEAATHGFNFVVDFESFFDFLTLLQELEEKAKTKIDLSGNSLPRAPDFSATAALTYRADLGRGGALTARGEYQYTTGVPFDPFARFEQPAYGLLHANLRWSTPDDRFSVNLYGRNLTDDEYRLTEFSSNYTTSLRVWAPPRELGLQLGFDFGGRRR